MQRRTFSRRTTALLIGFWLLTFPDTILASDNAPQLSFASQGAATSFGLLADDDNRRFTYADFGERRGEKAARPFQLSMSGIPGELGQLLTNPLREPKTTAVFLLGVTALVAVDRQTTIFWQDNVEPAFDGINPPPCLTDPTGCQLKASI
ncbi:MAG: hypothetical protein GY945_09890 [Rhodobacteraceae bacterium]|nr:hypothetical protein [Paracoccaceae bacterium]